MVLLEGGVAGNFQLAALPGPAAAAVAAAANGAAAGGGPDPEPDIEDEEEAIGDIAAGAAEDGGGGGGGPSAAGGGDGGQGPAAATAAQPVSAAKLLRRFFTAAARSGMPALRVLQLELGPKLMIGRAGRRWLAQSHSLIQLEVQGGRPLDLRCLPRQLQSLVCESYDEDALLESSEPLDLPQLTSLDVRTDSVTPNTEALKWLLHLRSLTQLRLAPLLFYPDALLGLQELPQLRK